MRDNKLLGSFTYIVNDRVYQAYDITETGKNRAS